MVGEPEVVAEGWSIKKHSYTREFRRLGGIRAPAYPHVIPSLNTLCQKEKSDVSCYESHHCLALDIKRKIVVSE